MKKIYNIFVILLLTMLLSACELGIPSEDILPGDGGVIDDNKECEHLWDDGVIQEIEGITYRIFSCINCNETKNEDIQVGTEIETPVNNEYLITVKRGRLHLYEKLQASYEPNELIEIKLNPQETKKYKVFLDEEELIIKEYKKDYWLYEFIMPEKDVQLIIYTEDDETILNGEFIPLFISKNCDYTFNQSETILIENNTLLIDEDNKLKIQEISPKEGLFNFLSDQSIYNQEYSDIIDKIREQTIIYTAYQDKEAIPCYQGEYYSVYYFVKIEDKIIYIPTIQNISNDEIICDAMYTLIKSQRKTLFVNSYVTYYTVTKIEENSNSAYIINNLEQYNNFLEQYQSFINDIKYYDIYSRKYDETYFETNQLFVFLYDYKNSGTVFTIHGGSLQSNYHDYSMRISIVSDDEVESTRLVIIEYQFNKKRIESIILKCNSESIYVKSE